MHKAAFRYPSFTSLEFRFEDSLKEGFSFNCTSKRGPLVHPKLHAAATVSYSSGLSSAYL